MLSGALGRIYFGRHPSTHFPGASMRGRGEGLARGTTGVSTRSVGAARDSTGKGLLETVDCGPELFRASLLLCDHGRRRLGAELWIVELGLDTLQLIQQLGLLACDDCGIGRRRRGKDDAAFSERKLRARGKLIDHRDLAEQGKGTSQTGVHRR